MGRVYRIRFQSKCDVSTNRKKFWKAKEEMGTITDSFGDACVIQEYWFCILFNLYNWFLTVFYNICWRDKLKMYY